MPKRNRININTEEVLSQLIDIPETPEEAFIMGMLYQETKNILTMWEDEVDPK